jgi:hypothetical protein
MATTTNYGWTTPNDTDLVKDGASAIRTLGSSIDTTTKNLNPSTTLGDIEYRSSSANTNTRLAIGTTGQVLTVAGGVPTWSNATDQTPLTTKGDLFTYSTTDDRLGVGTNGQYLVADSVEATGLKWVTPPASGKILQVVTATGTTDTTISTTTFADCNLSATITPTSATSTIMVLFSLTFDIYRASNAASFGLNLVRASTDIWTTGIDQFTIGASGPTAMQLMGVATVNYVDSPATTSATTYKVQGAINNTANSQRLLCNNGSQVSTITLMEIGA